MISAIVMAATIVAGFSLQLAMGRSTFGAPVLVHIHALVFFGWTIFYVLQNALVATGSVATHRRLGWFGAGWAAAIVFLGIFTTAAMVRRGASPFFFQPAYFLVMNSLSVICFGGLVTGGLILRRRTAWHRRLIFCAMATLTGPAFGRLLPMPLMIPWAAWGVYVAVMLFPIAGVIADWRRTGMVHPGWWWGIAAITGTQLTMDAVAFSPIGTAIYRVVTQDAPGAAVSPLDFPPPPPM